MNRIHTTSGLLGYAFSPKFKELRNWWLRRCERHFLICADVEQERVNQANLNVAYYQKKAAMARSARI
jgi:hypothetical protein